LANTSTATLRLLFSGFAAALLLSGCAMEGAAPGTLGMPLTVNQATAPEISPEDAAAGSLNGMIGRYAALYEVPESLVRRIIVRESGYNSRARHGAFWGLMQIRYDTARSMGYAGPASGLLDADTNLRYGVKYLAGAYKVARGNPDRAVRFYASGYYYDARRMGLLEAVGLKRGK
jgi:soluble lytic murein transglycosylase-like protein